MAFNISDIAENLEPLASPPLEILVRIYQINTINLSAKYLVTSHKDVSATSQNQLDSLSKVKEKFKQDRTLWQNHLNNLKKENQ